MKKRISLLLVLMLCFSSLTVSAAESFFTGTISSIGIESTSEMLSNKESADTLVATSTANLLKNAEKTTDDISTLTSYGNLVVNTSVNTKTTYTIYTGEKAVYLRNGSAVRKIDSTSWNTWANQLGRALYPYANIPTITTGKVALGIKSATYSYYKMDGIYYNVTPSEDQKIASVITLAQLKELALSKTATAESTTVAVTLSGNNVLEGDFAKLATFAPTKAGTYTITVTSTYNNSLYKGTVVSHAILKQDAISTTKSTGDISFTIKGGNNLLGELAVIQAHNLPATEKVTVTSNLNFSPNFFDDGNGGQIALLPLNYRNNPGKSVLTISGGGVTQKVEITVNDKTFQIQYLTADATNASETLLSQEANAEYEKNIASLRSVSHSTPYFQNEKFVWPLSQYRVTTQFGMKRYVNGASTTYRHGAIDMAAPQGTRINATNNGKVLFAGFLKLTGYTIVIEHGYGLKSWYYHMSSTSVKTGDTVKVGQEVGKVGSTGFSTGPHLHFGMSVNHVFINPETLINTDILDSEKDK